MFEFLLALFGGTYYAKKFSSENSKIANAKERAEIMANAWKIGAEAWEKRVTDADLQRQLEDAIYHGEDWVKAELANVIKDNPNNMWISLSAAITAEDVDRIYGKSTKSEQDKSIKFAREKAIDILLARRGKLTYSLAMFGTPLLGGQYSPEARNVSAHQYEYLRYIDSELKKHGIMEPLSFKDYNKNIIRVNEQLYMRGTYSWKPELLL